MREVEGGKGGKGIAVGHHHHRGATHEWYWISATQKTQSIYFTKYKIGPIAFSSHGAFLLLHSFPLQICHRNDMSDFSISPAHVIRRETCILRILANTNEGPF